jgi:hypothetical protein
MDELLTPQQMTELVPDTSEPYWAQLRFNGTGPAYLKPSPKKVLYQKSDVIEWLQSSKRFGTAKDAI